VLIGQNALDAKCLTTFVTVSLDCLLSVVLAFLFCRICTTALLDIAYTVDSFDLSEILHQLWYLFLVKVCFIRKQKWTLHSIRVDLTNVGICNSILFLALSKAKAIVSITQLNFDLALKYLKWVLLVLDETAWTDFLFEIFSFLLRLERNYLRREWLILRFVRIL
jgi:hypothetical protein